MRLMFFLVFLIFISGCGGPSDEELLRQFGGDNPNAGQTVTIDTTIMQEDFDTPVNEEYAFKINMAIPINKRHDFRYFKDINDSNYKSCNIYVDFNAASMSFYDVQAFTTSVVFNLSGSWGLEYNPENGNYILSNTGSNPTSEVPLKVYLSKDKSKVDKLLIGNRMYTNTATVNKSTPKPTRGSVAAYGNANEYKVKSGDFANSIAANHNLTLQQFLSMNPRVKARKDYTVIPGEYVKIY